LAARQRFKENCRAGRIEIFKKLKINNKNPLMKEERDEREEEIVVWGIGDNIRLRHWFISRVCLCCF
jgi:hypothetical protein